MSNLALLGGNPERTKPFPTWPPVTDPAKEALAGALAEGVWSAADGPRKVELERRFAEYHDARFGVAVSNGTVSLQIALAALDIGSGDEVIVPGYTFLATASSVLTMSALPVFVDIDPETACMDPAAVEAAITERTKAIMPVHLGGHTADLDALLEISTRHGIPLIEDAAQAHGASWNGRRVGSFGSFGSFSFQASKNMTGGEGGMLTTNDENLADLAWSFHHCGRSRSGKWYDHAILGANHRLTEFQAALLLVQLDTADAEFARRERGAAILDRELAQIEGIRPLGRDSRCTGHAHHLYQLRYDAAAFGGVPRDRFIQALRAEGIPCSGGYGTPLDRQPVFAKTAFDTKATGYDPDYELTRYGQIELPETARLCEEAVWFSQNMLLAEDADIADIVAAVGKIRESAADLA